MIEVRGEESAAMRVCSAVLGLAFITLVAPTSAAADFVHVVTPGESLTSVAATDGLSVQQLAAANGLSTTAQLIVGSALQIPPQGAPVAAATQPVSTTSPVVAPSQPASSGDGDGDADDPAATGAVGGGSYVVQPGDTLTAIAARAGTTVAQLAAANGLDPSGFLLAGSVLRLSGSGTTFVSATTATAATQPVGAAAEGSPVDPPYPTPQTLSAGQIGSIAQANGVSPSLADAIAWQESGFNNDLVSSADARGIMQILPGTWQWIQNDLNAAGPPLAPASANDNVRGGVLMLRSLLNSTGGDPAMAAAGYFQGLPSVQQNGMYPSTQQYVNDVMALRQQFGGG